MTKETEWITAAEHMAQLQKNPDWVARNANRGAERLRREEELLKEETPLISDLVNVGIRVSSVWDFVNTSDKYSAAIPILLHHLSLSYSKRTKEGIVRALTVNYAGPSVLRELIRQYQEQKDDSANSLKWVLGNAISQVATPADAETVIGLATNPAHGKARDMITQRLPRVVRNAVRLREVLQHLMRDEQTEPYARRASRGRSY
jgi:hypothetical protein